MRFDRQPGLGHFESGIAHFLDADFNDRQVTPGLAFKGRDDWCRLGFPFRQFSCQLDQLFNALNRSPFDFDQDIPGIEGRLGFAGRATGPD